MKKLLNLAGAALVAASVLSCSFPYQEPQSPAEQSYVPIAQRVSVDSLESNFAKALWHQVNAAEATVKAVERYVDLGDEGLARMARDGAAGIQDIGRLLPEDLSTLTRTRSPGAARGAGEEETLNLQDELDEIALAFEREVTALVPQLADGEYEGIAYIADGMIHLGDCVSYPQYSMEGIAIAEIAQAVANGEDAEEASQRIAREIEEIFGAEEDEPESMARGLYLRQNPRWFLGSISYVWGPEIKKRPDFQREIRRAMNDWQDAAQGRIRFGEEFYTNWNGHLNSISLSTLVKIEMRAIKGGSASVGSNPLQWNGGLQVNLARDLPVTNSDTGETIYAVALHELGHVLGLRHEHQRADRNTYLELRADQLDKPFYNDVYAETWYAQWSFVIEWRKIRIFRTTILVPWIVLRSVSTPQFEKTGDFDFNSIMIYHGIPIRPGYGNDANGIFEHERWVTRYTTELSPRDIAFIRRLY